MKLKQRIATVMLCSTLALSQAGCLGGIFIWPLWIPGIMVSAAGITVCAVGGALYRYPSGYWGGGYYGMGGALIAIGLLLDKDNPNYAEGLNELPLSKDLARTLGVELSDIEHYNNDLLKIRQVGREMTEDFRDLYHDKNVVNIATHGPVEQLTQNEKLGRFAQKYGFGSAENLLNGQHSKHKILPKTNLGDFAKAVSLEESDAKILLYTGFGIQSE